MTSQSAVRFGARRALIAGPEAYEWDVGIVGTIAVPILRRLLAKPMVDLEGERLVFGRKWIPFDQITDATLEVNAAGPTRDLAIRFGPVNGPKAIVFLRHGDRLVQTANQRRVVLAVLAKSRIVVPSSPFDQTGSHARWNFPTSLTQEQAISIVENPPGPADPLPIPE